jgi:hypothetical protein
MAVPLRQKSEDLRLLLGGDELWKKWELLDLFSDLLHLAK